jgi:hypothetical protein
MPPAPRCLIAASLLAGFATLGPRPVLAQQAPQAAPSATVVGHGPNGATLRCRDGSYPTPGAPDSACDAKGGVLTRFPVVRRPAASTGAAVRAARPARDPRLSTRDTTPPEGFVSHEEMRRQVQAENARGGRPPEGATLLCANGTYVVADTSATRCAQAGGVRLRFEPRRRTP